MDSSDYHNLHHLLSDEGQAEQIIAHVEAMLGRRSSDHAEEKRGLVDRLEQSQRLLRLKSEMLSTLSFEVRTPLTTILILCDLLKRHKDNLSEEKRARFIDQIQAQAERLRRVVSQVSNMNDVAFD